MPPTEYLRLNVTKVELSCLFLQNPPEPHSHPQLPPILQFSINSTTSYRVSSLVGVILGRSFPFASDPIPQQVLASRHQNTFESSTSLLLQCLPWGSCHHLSFAGSLSRFFSFHSCSSLVHSPRQSLLFFLLLGNFTFLFKNFYFFRTVKFTAKLSGWCKEFPYTPHSGTLYHLPCYQHLSPE